MGLTSFGDVDGNTQRLEYRDGCLSGSVVPAESQAACGLDYVLIPNNCSETQAVHIRGLWHFSWLQL